MIVYHFDKFGTLSPKTTIFSLASSTNTDLEITKRFQRLNTLFEQKMQLWGMRMLVCPSSNEPELYLTEWLLEYVRALRFPTLPSRFTVLFASRTLEAAQQWASTLYNQADKAQIVRLLPLSDAFVADAAHRDEVSLAVLEYVQGYPLLHPSFLSANSEFSTRLAVLSSDFFPALLAHTSPHILAYWKSVVPLTDTLNSYDCEELLLVPPVRVLDYVVPYPF